LEKDADYWQKALPLAMGIGSAYSANVQGSHFLLETVIECLINFFESAQFVVLCSILLQDISVKLMVPFQ